MGGAESFDDPSAIPPLRGIDETEWSMLVDRGRAAGELHAEDVAHVLRGVELTSEALTSVHGALAAHGITIDEEVQDSVDDTPGADGPAKDESPGCAGGG